MDWTACNLVERVPDKVGGKPVVKGTRILADTIVEDHELGAPVEEIHESFPVAANRHHSQIAGLRTQQAACFVKVLLNENMPHQLRAHLDNTKRRRSPG
jgi:Protein of unknown function (DUF433)